MNKADLIENVAKAADLSKANASIAVTSVFDAISASLKKGKSVSLVGFGTFSVTNRKARIARNPRTGETIKIKATRAAKFKAGKGLKEAEPKLHLK